MGKVGFKRQDVLILYVNEKLNGLSVLASNKLKYPYFVRVDKSLQADVLKQKQGDILNCWAYNEELGVDGNWSYTESSPIDRLINIADFHQQYIAPMLDRRPNVVEYLEKHAKNCQSVNVIAANLALDVAKEAHFSAKDRPKVEEALARLRRDLYVIDNPDPNRRCGTNTRFRSCHAIGNNILELGDVVGEIKRQKDPKTAKKEQTTLEQWCP